MRKLDLQRVYCPPKILTKSLIREVKLDTEAAYPVPYTANVPVRVVRDEDVPVAVMNSDRFIKLTLSCYDFYS